MRTQDLNDFCRKKFLRSLFASNCRAQPDDVLVSICASSGDGIRISPVFLTTSLAYSSQKRYVSLLAGAGAFSSVFQGSHFLTHR